MFIAYEYVFQKLLYEKRKAEFQQRYQKQLNDKQQ